MAAQVNGYFEGSALKNTLANYGKSKEKRTDCPLVVLALVVDGRGLPLFSQIYKGNQSEPETLETILDRLYVDGDTLFKETLPTIVMDRGIATKENILLLKTKQYPYIVVERRPVEKEYTKEFETAKESFARIDSLAFGTAGELAVFVKKVLVDDSCRVLCLSEGRAQKNSAMDTLKGKRFLEDLTRLQNSVSKRNILLVGKISERMGV